MANPFAPRSNIINIAENRPPRQAEAAPGREWDISSQARADQEAALERNRRGAARQKYNPVDASPQAASQADEDAPDRNARKDAATRKAIRLFFALVAFIAGFGFTNGHVAEAGQWIVGAMGALITWVVSSTPRRFMIALGLFVLGCWLVHR